MTPQEHADFYITEEIQPAHEKKGFTKTQRLIALGLVAGSLFFSGCNNSSNNVEIKSRPVAEAPADPYQTPQATGEVATTNATEKGAIETMPTVESLEMDASLLSDPEALIETFENQRFTEWFNAGATPENAQVALNSGNIPAYAAEIAPEYDEIFIKALLIKDWQSNPALVELVNKMTVTHQQTLALYFYTFPNPDDQEDKEAYMRGTKVTKMVSSTNNYNGSVSITYVGHDYDNADLNRVGEKLTGGVKVAGEEGEPTITFAVESGKARVSDIIFGQKVANN